ncbi:MAG: endonuclease domain-containing protein [Actinobacteria bacterium]|nr:endonuclease domain-containing protein [Actinomycetota bacterium]
MSEGTTARARAIDRAEQQRLLDMRALDDVLARASGRRGAKLLREVLAEHRAASTLTRNELEEAFLSICRTAGLPPDAVNLWIPFPDGGGAEADFLWHAQRLIVEVDGRSVHATQRAFQSDRRRDQRLMLLGWRVARFTCQQVTSEPAYVATTLRGLLEHG